MAGDEANISAALGAVLGYIGAEAATPSIFERLLWPQRAYAHFRLALLPGAALATSMDGPLHKAALKTLDTIFDHGLLRGAHQGHMLGSAFFPDQGWQYTMHGGGEYESHTEDVRNGFWPRVLGRIPVAAAAHGAAGPVALAAARQPPPLRARVAVHRLKIRRATALDRRQGLPFVSEDTGVPCRRVFAGILASELSAVLTAIGIAVFCRSAWAAFWLCPLLLRLLSACFALHREGLVSAVSDAPANETACHFNIHCPQSNGNFIVLTGAPSLVLQFFRHYGHPKRDRFREVLQLGVVLAFIFLFPLGLVCSTLWMPVAIQYVWVCWQLYAVLALHAARYSHVGAAASTESAAAAAFARQLARGAGDRRDASLLLGGPAAGRETLRVDLTVTYHRRNLEGQQAVKAMLRNDIEDGFGVSPTVSSCASMSSATSSDTLLPEKKM